MREAYYEAASRMPGEWRDILYQVHPQLARNVTEIRLRSNCPLAVTWKSRTYYLSARGEFQERADNTLPCISHRRLQECFAYLCKYSVFSYENQLKQGFFTLSGGHRVGIASAAVYENNGLLQPKSITSLNVRIARLEGLEEPETWKELLLEPCPRILIAGTPGSGKTTLLRALSFLLSDQGRRVVVLDERQELFPLDAEGFCWQQPSSCDVLSGYPKTVGMAQALRSLSPEIFICDELAGREETERLIESLNTGVGFVAAIHAGSFSEVWRKPQIQMLKTAGGIGQVVLLEGSGHPGRIREKQYVDV